jgi:hypothetical protein
MSVQKTMVAPPTENTSLSFLVKLKELELEIIKEMDELESLPYRHIRWNPFASQQVNDSNRHVSHNNMRHNMLADLRSRLIDFKRMHKID